MNAEMRAPTWHHKSLTMDAHVERLSSTPRVLLCWREPVTTDSNMEPMVPRQPTLQPGVSLTVWMDHGVASADSDTCFSTHSCKCLFCGRRFASQSAGPATNRPVFATPIQSCTIFAVCGDQLGSTCGTKKGGSGIREQWAPTENFP